MKRIKYIDFAPEFFSQWCTSRNWFSMGVEGAPAGSKFVGWTITDKKLRVYIEHESFSEVEDGAKCPELIVKFNTGSPFITGGILANLEQTADF